MPPDEDPTPGQPGQPGEPGEKGTPWAPGGAGGTGGTGGAGGVGRKGKKGEPGDNSHAIKVTDRRLLYMMGFVVLAVTVLGVRDVHIEWVAATRLHAQDLRNYAVCQQTHSLTLRINSFATRQIALDKTNTALGREFLNERAVLYRDLLTVPKTCGAKP